MKIIVIVLVIIAGCFVYAYDQIYLESGRAVEKKTVLIKKGDNALIVGEKLSEAGVITGKYYFAFYLFSKGELHNLVAGVYDFTPGLKIPEIANIITGGEVVSMRIPITFPEGWTSKQMAGRLDANNFSGGGFLSVANSPSLELKAKYDFLAIIPKGGTLEGYLFPDTYYFASNATAQEIVEKMLKNFDARVASNVTDSLNVKKKSLFEIITMASIVEGEVRNDSDRKVVAGLFWNRLENGMPLQSDATLEYVLGGNKFQHSVAETKTDSPYNTYQNRGLPPGPVSNPGMASILAALNPEQTEYVYFLTDPKTGNTAFAKTFEQHIANKAKYGL